MRAQPDKSPECQGHSIFLHLINDHYDDIVGIARRLMRRERKGHTFGATGGALANEIVLRLLNSSTHTATSRDELLIHSTNAARRVLVDYSRMRSAEKRSHDRRVEMPTDVTDAAWSRENRALEIDELLQKLSLRRPRAERVLHLEYFGGLSQRTIGRILGISQSSVQRESDAGRDWLASELGIQ